MYRQCEIGKYTYKNIIYKNMNMISGISSLLAIGILTPVQSILFLIILFVSTAICLYSQGYMLMGILYVLIYVGAIAILFLFILSLLKIDYIEQKSISPLILTILVICLLPLDLSYETNGIVENINTIWFNWSSVDGILSTSLTNELIVVGNQFYTEYAVLLIIIGLILILSVIGAIAITK